MKVTVSNNNEKETTRTVSSKTTERDDKPKEKRGDTFVDDTEQDMECQMIALRGNNIL